MKKLFLFFSLMVATMALVSCGNDDEPNLQFDKETIVGAWGALRSRSIPTALALQDSLWKTPIRLRAARSRPITPKHKSRCTFMNSRVKRGIP